MSRAKLRADIDSAISLAELYGKPDDQCKSSEMCRILRALLDEHEAAGVVERSTDTQRYKKWRDVEILIDDYGDDDV